MSRLACCLVGLAALGAADEHGGQPPPQQQSLPPQQADDDLYDARDPAAGTLPPDDLFADPELTMQQMAAKLQRSVDGASLLRARRVFNVANGALLATTGPVALAVSLFGLKLSNVLISLYVTVFGGVLASVELGLAPIAPWVSENLSYLSTTQGRTALLAFLGGLTWPLGRLGLVPALLTCANALFNAHFGRLLRFVSEDDGEDSGGDSEGAGGGVGGGVGGIGGGSRFAYSQARRGGGGGSRRGDGLTADQEAAEKMAASAAAAARAEAELLAQAEAAEAQAAQARDVAALRVAQEARQEAAAAAEAAAVREAAEAAAQASEASEAAEAAGAAETEAEVVEAMASGDGDGETDVQAMLDALAKARGEGHGGVGDQEGGTME